ncbi:hypothetical protein L6E12_29245 [Actinokineospora sp. PR83]|uniref:STAS domain-containing protein n=1 Tax=Actinokineospora sp. PR83 TaxID=2884908 RepID=UPI001F20A70C|nr:STAS domain-containing protein [Actinokineospora sp. PR83]MCG8919863.1 hypothetical protein [Actinokineospora sp. PR83]
MHIVQEPAGTATVVRIAGRIDRSHHAEIRRHLLRCAAEVPAALVVDVRSVQCADPIALAVFVTVAEQLSRWPGVPLRLVCGRDSRAVGADSPLLRFLDVHATTEEALAADPGGSRVVSRVELPNDHSAMRLGRGFVRDTLLVWDLDQVAQDCLLMSAELVQNTIQHTLSAPTIRLEHRRGVLTVAVYDDDPHHPEHVPDPDEDLAGTHGLDLVAFLAAAWGTAPTPGGGKVVWATLRTEPAVSV